MVGEVVLDQGNLEAPDAGAPNNPLLRVRRPKLTPAPQPPGILRDFLLSGWEDPDRAIEVQATRNVVRNETTVTEAFADDQKRVASLASWTATWEQWRNAERPSRAAMRTFERLFALRARLEREGEGLELVLGDGRLRWRSQSGDIDHPVLLQRVELIFDPAIPEFRVIDSDRAAELYGTVLQAGDGLSPAELSKLRTELETGGFHPLNKDATSIYLRGLAQRVGARGTFQPSYVDAPIGPDPSIVRDPVLFLRTRVSGVPAAIDRILAALEKAMTVPVALARLVGVEAVPPQEETTFVTSPWGEPPDVLLSKPANPEQIQIARALDRHKAVLVQGPPGTGKSHTIANLIGHLVASGKRVLVTSHATKALRVLREQVVEELRPLCVSVLDQDLDSRTQMEQSVRGILTRLTQSTPEQLDKEVQSFTASREALNREVDDITRQLLEAREAEYLTITLAGAPVAPSDAAREVRELEEGNDWIPGPLEPGGPCPLSPEELRTLYETNHSLTTNEEGEIDAALPDPDTLPTPEVFASLVHGLSARESEEQASFWQRPASEEAIPRLEALAGVVTGTAGELGRFVAWQRVLVAAGQEGGAARGLWDGLARQVADAHDKWQRTRAVLIDHSIALSLSQPIEQIRDSAEEIRTHLAEGGRLGWFQYLQHRSWKVIVEGARVNGHPPSSVQDFQALIAFVELRISRQGLMRRWQRQAESIGLPKASSMGEAPEGTLRELASQFAPLCSWWAKAWDQLQQAANVAEFNWNAFRSWHLARASKAGFELDSGLLADALPQAVLSRLTVARSLSAKRLLAEVAARLSQFRGSHGQALRDAVRLGDLAGYESAFNELARVAGKVGVWKTRQALLRRLGMAAPRWADAIRGRTGPHSVRVPPGDALVAWRWRQLRQELDRRAALDEVALTERLRIRCDELRRTTADLIDRCAWRAQIQRTDLPARQALQGWADTVKKMRGGTGKRVPELQVRARALLAQARDAVPVWIMPLARVAESFNPDQARFDVVIVDEASQSDVTGLLAWFLADRVAIVGDHEQVSPMAVGQEIDAMRALIAQHLDGIPNHHLYDGSTSIYDLARQSFGGTIALREHFRCVPDIIEFSNELSYNFEIKPLRNPSSTAQPHVVEYVVSPELGASRDGKANLAEARCVVALLKAATELPDFDGKSFGAISLLGDEQAGLIHDLAVSELGAVELEKRRFVAGNSAQFQGDERHVMFLSMVDVPKGAPLALNQRPEFKQRYNVAASRAKDQLWLVHSLDPGKDLKPGDLRKRLIDYVRDPSARRRELQKAERRAESPFEKRVLERLIAAGYRTEPQVWIGRYRIDIVVSGDGKQVAVECDGDRFHGLDQIPADMERQAILERAGWRFVRVRGSRFFGDPDQTMAWVFSELMRLGVGPSAASPEPNAVDEKALAFRDRLIRRAWEIIRERGWSSAPTQPIVPPPSDFGSLTPN